MRASNSAGSSGYSGIVNVTTPTSGGGGGTAGRTYHFDQWATGYVAYVTVNGPMSGWSIPFTLGSGNTITSSWNATVTVSGTSGTATNASYNGTVAAGQSTQWGFQGTRPSGGPLPSFPVAPRPDPDPVRRPTRAPHRTAPRLAAVGSPYRSPRRHRWARHWRGPPCG